MRDSVEAPQSREARRERFEFELTVDGNMICQRYFKINAFKEDSFRSVDFIDTIEECVSMIKSDLVSKSKDYMEHMAPLIFKNEEQMRGYLFNADGSVNEKHTKYIPGVCSGIPYGRHIILREENHEYVWAGNKLVDEGERKPDDINEFVDKDTQRRPNVFKFTMFDNGKDWLESPRRREVVSTIWDGDQYPSFVRNAVDISNGRGRYDEFDITKASHEQCLYYWCNAGRQDLVPVIIRMIAETCSYEDKNDYTTTLEYGDVVYENKTYSQNAQESKKK